MPVRPMTERLIVAAAVLLSASAAAQNVTVYSELTRIDPYGKPAKADRGSHDPREILSPGAPRGAYSSFRLVVEGNPGDSYTVQVAQNPVNAVRATAYRERYSRAGDEWVADGLEPVKMPYEGRLGSAEIADQTAQSFWIDMWVDRTAPVQRIKVEPQVYIGNGWIRYPMEVRITAPTMGAGPLRTAVAQTVGEPTSTSVVRTWVEGVCNSRERNKPEQALTIRNLIARNAGQDVRLAGASPPPSLLRALRVSDRAVFCRSGQLGFESPEEYLRIRDVLIGARE